MKTPNSTGFFCGRWRGEAPVAVLYWRDMLAIGSLINFFTGFVALMLVAQGVDVVIAAAVHFGLLPYNAFLVAALWRTPHRSDFMAWTSLVWLAAVTVI